MRELLAIMLAQSHQADAVAFLIHDPALPQTLRFYYGECERLHASERQLQGIALLIERVERWQHDNPGQLRVAAVDEGAIAIGNSIIEPNEV